MRRLIKKFGTIFDPSTTAVYWGMVCHPQRECGKNDPSRGKPQPEISPKRTFRWICWTGIENKLYLPWANIGCFNRSRRTVSLILNRAFRLTRTNPSLSLFFSPSLSQFLSIYNLLCITYLRNIHDHHYPRRLCLLFSTIAPMTRYYCHMMQCSVNKRECKCITKINNGIIEGKNLFGLDFIETISFFRIGPNPSSSRLLIKYKILAILYAR